MTALVQCQFISHGTLNLADLDMQMAGSLETLDESCYRLERSGIQLAAVLAEKPSAAMWCGGVMVVVFVALFPTRILLVSLSFVLDKC